ncbi:hypothetical protein LCI18_002108 [Fusarium solani-melongenae]|uniref:Uncharacterized protein n=1 Tax=Fusarium solani subsp. cucurbitae TaxID=2747967 RepID=A0ACD3YTJ2_FUSSC|nr:hypothetical protein LCI18_002108 [Fusarium solani-melongenae]
MAQAPKKYGVVLYEGFQLIDVCGPIDVLNVLTTHVEGISLSIISESLKSTSTFPKTWPDKMGMPQFTTSQLMTPTHTFETAPQLDVLIIPGGMGCFDPDPNNVGQPNPTVVNSIVKFIQKQYPGLKYLVTVCTGSGITSLSGLLDGKKATTARWVVDGNIWTSSGVCSGIDLMFGFVKEVYGEKIAQDIAVWMEYQRHEDPTIDPFGIEG